ncbi:MAG TPA: MmgE/PrpD family protein [Burkholderiales bacterium]|nr:MmgE/PrpD family protein [Burkholderiales bacterium]
MNDAGHNAATVRRGAAIHPVMVRLSEYMSGAADRALPADVIRETRHHILDTIAAMVSGADLVPGRHALRFAREYGGEKIATVVASDALMGPIEAAMVNGVLANADETDDNYSTGGAHPGCAVVPAALAIGEKYGIAGAQFIRAVALGYDVGLRAFKLVAKGGVLAETHNIVGTFGASAACGCAVALDTPRMRTLIDYASQQAGAGIGAWRQDTEHVEKSFMFGGMGARNGVTAALLVHAGWTGVDDVFSGPGNLFQSYAPGVDPELLVHRLGEEFEVQNTIIKKWSTGGPIQSPLEAIQLIRRRRPFELDEIRSIDVRVSTRAADKIDDSVMANLSMQYLIAVVLIDGTLSFTAAHDDARMRDPAVLRQKAKIRVIADESLERLLPARVAVVDVAFTDGTVVSERNDTVRGSPGNPMTSDEVTAKARDLMAPVLGAQKCATLIERIFALEEVANIRELRPLLQRAGTKDHR